LYEEWARVLCGEFVAVKFVDAMPEGIPKSAIGCAQWQGSHFEALLNLYYYGNDCAMRDEKQTAAHEIAHIALGHPVKKQPEQITVARKAFDALPLEVRQVERKPIEDEANALAEKILKLWKQDPRINW
jgi:hypothetical protein